MGSVQLLGVRKDYAGAPVIHGVDLEVRDGEFLVLVGPSGCGKSTLLRMIAGLEEISAGELRIGGQRANELRPADRGAAMVFQSYALYPHMTVAENMGFALKMAGVARSERESAVHRAAEALRITHLLPRRPKALSGGERQRVAIGRAIVRKPKVFLFDEPLSNLDAALRVSMRIELARLHQELGTTMIYVTHDQVEAMTLGQRIAVLRQGYLEQIGPPLELYHEPANQFVATFLGAPRINLVPRPTESASPAHRALWHILVPQASSAAQQAGVRPEHLELVAQGEGHGAEAELALWEHLGDASIAHLRVEGLPDMLTAKLASTGTPASTGARVGLRVSTSQVMTFDAEGRRLAGNPG